MTSNSTEPPVAGPPPERPSSLRRWRRYAVWLGIATALLIGGAVVSRSRTRAVAPSSSDAAASDAPRLDGNFMRFSDAFAARAKLSNELPRSEAIAPIVTVAGMVTYDPQRFAAIGARTSGRVRKVMKVVGDDVKAGEVLARLESADVGRAESQVLAARAKEHAAELDMNRERRLADSRITAERDAEFAKAAHEAAKSERTAAERAVQALGGDLDEHLGEVTLRSPIAGRVVAAKVARGQTLEPSDTLYEVADLSVLWVELRVFERDVDRIRIQDHVEISPQSSTVPPLIGVVAHVGDVIDPKSRTAPVRVVVDNPNRVLRPGQSVLARVQTSAGKNGTLSVPRRAVTRIDGKPTVFVLHDKNTVEPRNVMLGPEDAERAAILQGLNAKERVVVDGMFALKSEIFR